MKTTIIYDISIILMGELNNSNRTGVYFCAYSILDGKIFKIYKAKFEEGNSLDFGTIKDDKVACKGGYIQLQEVQIEGKKKMDIEEFTRGFKLDGQVLN